MSTRKSINNVYILLFTIRKIFDLRARDQSLSISPVWTMAKCRPHSSVNLRLAEIVEQFPSPWKLGDIRFRQVAACDVFIRRS